MNAKEHEELFLKLENQDFKFYWNEGRRAYHRSNDVEQTYNASYVWNYNHWKAFEEGWNFERSNFVRERRRNSRIIQSSHY